LVFPPGVRQGALWDQWIWCIHSFTGARSVLSRGTLFLHWLAPDLSSKRPVRNSLVRYFD
jgi:hypothetical protein